MGEITALIGPSGCGKSTFLRSLNLMNREIRGCRVEGDIFYQGRNINTETENLYELRRSIGMVFQQPNPFRKSIYENITFAPRRHGVTDRAELDALVESSLRGAALWDEVKDKLDKSAQALSGGQQQRLCIARTLALNPDVILFDEPCSALDPISTLAIEDLMNELAETRAIIIVTHNMEQALARLQPHRLLLHGRYGRVRRDRADLHPSARQAPERLPHGNVLLVRNVSQIARGSACAPPVAARHASAATRIGGSPRYSLFFGGRKRRHSGWQK